MGRMELYVDADSWKGADKQTQMLLNELMNKVDEQMGDTILEWNKSRTKIINNKDGDPSNLVFKVKSDMANQHFDKKVSQKWLKP